MNTFVSHRYRYIYMYLLYFLFFCSTDHRHRKLIDIPPSSTNKFPVPLHPRPPPHAPSQPLASPLTASSVLTYITSLITLPSSESVLSPEETPTTVIERARAATPPQTIDLNQPINNGVLYETGGSGFLNHGAQDLTPVPVAENLENERQSEALSTSKSKKKSKGKKKKRHKHSRPNPTNEDVQNSSTDAHEVAPRVNGVSEMVCSDAVGPVRVKQEPVSDHEEERAPVTKVRLLQAHQHAIHVHVTQTCYS